MTFTIFAFCSIFVAMAAAANMTLLYSFDIVDDAANFNYPDGSKEYHCFDTTAGVKSYVRGTYGNYAYFEGAVDPNNPLVFYIDWWETRSNDDKLVPSSGSVVLTYDADFSATQGTYWSAGTSDILNSYGLWVVQNGTLTANDSTPAGQSLIMQKCLYPGASVALPRGEIAALSNTQAISAKSGENEMSLCLMPAGPAVGPWLGSYTYYFGDDDGATGVEEGTHGTDGITFWGASSMGIAGTWQATTNDYAGTEGTSIYTVVATASTTSILGFYCYIDENYVRTSCYSESYSVSGVNQNTQDCPSFYRTDNSLDDLYSFASVGSSLSDDDSQSNTVPFVLAILFGCLSGVLLAVVIYQCVMQRASAGPMSKKDGANIEM